MTNRINQIRDLLKGIETGDSTSVAVVNEAKYIQHNPQTHEGSEGLASLFARLSKTEPKVNMVRGFEDGEFVFAHMEYDFATRKICFEVFRFEEGKAVEHWDNIQPRLGPNGSGHSMVDGPTEVADLHLTERNRARVRDFINVVMIDHDLARLADFFDASAYVEHNPRLTDELSSVRSALQASTEKGRVIEYQKLHRVLAQGNFVLGVCEGQLNGVHTSFYDLFRLVGGKIVEHWDTTETIAPRSEWKNDNGKF